MLARIRISYCTSTTASVTTLLINLTADMTPFRQSSKGLKKRPSNDMSTTSMTMIAAKIKAGGTVSSVNYLNNSQKSNTLFSEPYTGGVMGSLARTMIVPFM